MIRIKLILIAALSFVSALSRAQTDSNTATKKMPSRDTTIYSKVDIESEYPGGRSIWQRYLNKYKRNPSENETGQTVNVQFIIDFDGHPSDIKAISGPTEGGYREEAIRLIKKSGVWTPAILNGRQVRAYKILAIEF
ncbi:MAG: energy transducer TonB [Bacteroidetes bacterium]|nr:energy transducer TonB [Bacteroidota bacterium]